MTRVLIVDDDPVQLRLTSEVASRAGFAAVTANGGKQALDAGFHPEYTEVFLQYGAERRVIFRTGTECPKEIKDLASQYFDKEGVLRPEAFAKFQKFLSKASEIEHDLRCYDDVLSFVAQVRDDDARERHLEPAEERQEQIVGERPRRRHTLQGHGDPGGLGQPDGHLDGTLVTLAL